MIFAFACLQLLKSQYGQPPRNERFTGRETENSCPNNDIYTSFATPASSKIDK